MSEKLIPYNAPKLHCSKDCPSGITFGNMELYFPLADEEYYSKYYRSKYPNDIVAIGCGVCEMCKFYNREKSTKTMVSLESVKGVVVCMHP